MGGKRQHNEQGLRIKKCPKCGETKDETQWNWRDKEHTVFSTYCKDCDRVRKTLAARKRYSVRENRVKENFRQKLWNRGVTIEQYNTMLDKANHSCEICNSRENLVIDHCHSTNKVRGILCWSCNIALGHFKDNLNSLKKAIKYLCQTANS